MYIFFSELEYDYIYLLQHLCTHTYCNPSLWIFLQNYLYTTRGMPKLLPRARLKARVSAGSRSA